VKLSLDASQGHVNDRGVENDHQLAETQNDEADPSALVGCHGGGT
jgi:hypothetical protein